MLVHCLFSCTADGGRYIEKVQSIMSGILKSIADAKNLMKKMPADDSGAMAASTGRINDLMAQLNVCYETLSASQCKRTWFDV